MAFLPWSRILSLRLIEVSLPAGQVRLIDILHALCPNHCWTLASAAGSYATRPGESINGLGGRPGVRSGQVQLHIHQIEPIWRRRNPQITTSSARKCTLQRIAL